MYNQEYDSETGYPADETYLEQGLPPYLQESLEKVKKCLEILDNGGEDKYWDCKWCELNADIGTAVVDRRISERQADYLRKKYLRMVEE